MKELIPPAKPGGRPRELNMRELVNAILYVTVSGIQWRLMPHDFPHWLMTRIGMMHKQGDNANYFA